MGQPGAKKTDLITSLTPGDVHLLVPPTGTPVPTPLPVPSSIIKDNVAKKVKLTGQAGAVKGSVSKHTPPHIPIPPATFSKPPANKGEIFTASSNVFYEGKAAAMLGDTAMMCCDPSDAPVGKVMGTAATVLIGGGGSGSDADRAAAAAAAMAAAQAAAAQSKLLLTAMTGTGHPIDVGSGQLVITAEDFSMGSPLPIQFVRTYLSSTSNADGPMGYGWVHNFQEQIELVDRDHAEWERIEGIYARAGDPAPNGRYLIYRDPNGIPAEYHLPDPGREVNDTIRRRRLGRDGSVVWMCDRAGKETRFAATDDARLLLPIEARDRNGNRNVFRYDDAGRLVEVEDCYGRSLLLAYTEDGHRLGELSIQESIKHPVRRWCGYKYDSDGNLVEVIDVMGAVTKYDYADHLIVEDRNRDGYSFYFAYDNLRRCVKTWGRDGYLTRHLSYDFKELRTLEVNGEGETTIYHLTPQGAVKRIEKGATGIVTDETTFDAGGRPVTRLRFGVAVMSVAYDDSGNISELTDAEQQSTKFTYNLFGQVTSKTTPAGATEQFRYDVRGNMVARVAADGATIRYKYNARGQKTAQQFPNKQTVRFAYDAFGNLRSWGDDQRWTLFEYDALGRPRKIAPSDGAPATYQWDARGYLTQFTIGDFVASRYEYNREGDVTAWYEGKQRLLHRYAVRRPGIVSEHTQHIVPPEAAANRIDEVRNSVPTNSDGDDRSPGFRYHVRYRRDTEGRVLSATDHLGRTARYEYDEAGRIVRRTGGNGVSVEYTRGVGGRVEQLRTLPGGTQQFEFDGRGFPTGVSYADQTRESFEYDEMGRLTVAKNPWAELSFEYDEAGRQVVRRQGDFEVTLSIDAQAGSVTRSYEDGLETRYEFGSDGRGRAVTFGGRRFESTRDDTARTAMHTFPNGVVQSLETDRYGRIVAMKLVGPADDADRVALSDGRRELLTQSVSYAGSNVQLAVVEDSRAGARRFHYDAQDRLTRVEPVAGMAPAAHATAAQAEFYRFDERDNLVASHRFGESTAGGDQILKAGDRAFTYDAEGRVIAISRGGQSHQFEYDQKGQVKRVSLPDGGEVEYRYDAIGRRLEKIFQGGVRDGRRVAYFWDADSLVKEEVWQHNERTVEHFYLFSGFVPLARVDRVAGVDDERTLYYHNDHSARPRLCTDDEGRIVWESNADGFGAAPSNGATVQQNIRLPGQYFDEETELCYNRHRYYDPATARYIQPDPLEREGDLSRYSYPTDPFARADPLGLSPVLLVGDPNDPVTFGGWFRDHNTGQTYWYEGTEAGLRRQYPNLETRILVNPNDTRSLSGVDHVIIAAHGSANGMEYALGTTGLTPPPSNGRDMGNYLKNKGLGQGGNAVQVTVISCNTGNTGAGGTSVGQDMADALGPNAVVTAPTDYVHVNHDGTPGFVQGSTGEMVNFRAPGSNALSPAPVAGSVTPSARVTQNMQAVGAPSTVNVTPVAPPSPPSPPSTPSAPSAPSTAPASPAPSTQPSPAPPPDDDDDEDTGVRQRPAQQNNAGAQNTPAPAAPPPPADDEDTGVRPRPAQQNNAGDQNTQRPAAPPGDFEDEEDTLADPPRPPDGGEGSGSGS